MKTNITARIIAALLVVLGAGSNGVSAKMSKALNDTASTGFNALDHVLQRPLGNPTFENKHFGDHFFVSAGGGLSVDEQLYRKGFRPGITGEFSFGDWVTPVHGWRVNLEAGLRSWRSGQPKTVFGAIGADYLMNFSSLIRGNNPARHVEVIGALGGQYRRLRNKGIWASEIGFNAGLQLRFNVQRNFYLYAEPRLGLFVGNRLPSDSYLGLRRSFSFHIGMGYRLFDKAMRMQGATPFISTPDSHLFFGAGGGIWAFSRKAASQRKHPYGFGTFFVGKYFTSTAGLRIKAEFGRIGHRRRPIPANLYLATGQLDFVWNLNSAFGGYRPDQVFDMSFNFGPAVTYADKSKGKFYPGVGAGFTALFRLSHNWGIFIEPEAKIFSDNCTRDLNTGGRGPFLSLSAGIRYDIGNFKHNFAESYTDFLKEKNYFLTFGGGIAHRWKGNYGDGISGQIGFGKRFSPISSWRITAEGDIFNASPAFMSLDLAADYMFSLSTSIAGFNPDRVFDLSALVGVTAGMGQYRGGMSGLIGGRAGLHGDFRLNDALDLYIEPQLVGNRLVKGGSNIGWTPEARLMLGLRYKLGSPEGVFGGIADSPVADGRNYFSVSGGPSAFSSTFVGSRHQVGGSLDFSLGRWFTQVSGARLGYTLDIVSGNKGERTPLFNSFHIDYLCNVTSIMDRNPARRFHIIALGGIGLASSNLKGSGQSPLVEGGAQFRYNFPHSIDLHIEPNVTAFANRMVPGYRSGAKIVLEGRVLAGLSFRF